MIFLLQSGWKCKNFRERFVFDYKNNNFNMEALKKIPKVLQKIQDLHKVNDSAVGFSEYKQNVRKFIELLTKELAEIIDKYESKIQELTKFNSQLHEALSLAEPISPIPTDRISSIKPKSMSQSPVKFKGLDFIQTAKSSVFSPFTIHNMQNGQKFSSVLAKYRNTDEDKNFPIELINPVSGEESVVYEGKSRFIAKSNKKKQKQEELLNFLQSAKKNMKDTTDRFMSAIGREKGNQKEGADNQSQNNDRSDSSLSAKKNDSSLNKSLGNICESLDSSFHSKKARSKNAKKREQVQQQIRRKQKHDEETARMLKDKGIQNLLQRLRSNVQNSQNPPQIIKSSKLISCGKDSAKAKKNPQQAQSPTRSKKGSKVLINPVPVDIARKSQVLKKEGNNNGVLSPEKRPQSILKQSSAVLTQSLSGISAIDFE